MSRYIKNEDGNFVCPSCNVIKEKQNTMYYHMKKHEGKLPFVCDICTKDFMQKTSLELHKISKHKIQDNELLEKFKCIFTNCDFEAITKANRRIHCMRKHCKEEVCNIMNEIVDTDNNSIYTCITCTKRFTNNTGFYYHAIHCISPTPIMKELLIQCI